MEERKVVTEVPAKKVTKTVYFCQKCGIQIPKKNEALYHDGLTHSFVAKKKIKDVAGIAEIWYFDERPKAVLGERI